VTIVESVIGFQYAVPMRPPRRVVTGHDESGRSVFLSDGPTPKSHDMGVATFHELWSTNAAPAPIAATEPMEPTSRPLITPPDANGTIVRFTDIPAGERSPMHRTETIDYGIVLEGEIHLVLDDAEVRLGVGDVVVQRGTDHAWDNRSDRTTRMAFILVDGVFSDELRAAIGTPELYDRPLDD
jgi:quercetin dioxygenase-like cupin family protein